jgi:hypothetical protein
MTTTLHPTYKSPYSIISSGNLVLNCTEDNFATARSVLGASHGKRYCEVTITDIPSSINTFTFGITTGEWIPPTGLYPFGTYYFQFAFSQTGYFRNNNTDIGAATGITMAEGDVFGCLLDMEAETFAIRQNGGSWVTRSFDGLAINTPDTRELFFGVTIYPNITTTLNFGGSTYASAKPTDALNWGEEPSGATIGAGRKVVSVPVVGGAVSASGTPTHWAAVDATNLLATGPVEAAAAITSGGGFDLDPITVIQTFNGG